MSPLLGRVCRTIRSVYYTVHHYGIGLLRAGCVSVCIFVNIVGCANEQLICGSSVVGQIGNMYHRLKTLRNGFGNAISNAIESRVPSSFA